MSSERDKETASLRAQRDLAWAALVRHTAQLTITLERANAALQPPAEKDDEENRLG